MANTTGKPAIEHSNPLAQTLLEKLDYDQLTNCMRCGFCLPACPTFRETGMEPASPRGRIALMKAAVDGIMVPDQQFEDQMNLCLGCRACEPACPADVKYGQLIEQTREAIEEHATHSLPIKVVRKTVFKKVFPKRSKLKLLGGTLAFYQKSGLQKVAHSTGAMKLFPKHLAEIESIMPSSSSKGVVDRLGTFYPAKGEAIAKVGMFRGCIMDVMFADTNVNTVELLSAAGFDVYIPESQVCCGALYAHSGEMNDARQLAAVNIDTFKQLGVDYVVSNAGGCGALLVEYDHLMQDDEKYRESAKWFASRVIDVSALIVEKGRVPKFAQQESSPQAERIKVTYQDSCHLRNVMKGSSAPRTLMKQVANTDYIEMVESDRCCGSAGIYNIVQPEMAGSILEHKMEHANNTQASYMLTSNPGCLLQMKVGIEKHQPDQPMKAMHIVDFLHDRMIVSE
ncbi:glycolate oxidase iron-sulfur subunit [Fontibacillus solani]|uniref:Glycolate oxidase iron-sulfur subunit n=1 Tax=Fontibacillus solani TaxID=1572857 RepID=A0A7W3XT27_9BACL|nr:(Fe-S)-binding protein [Fontibacillus solani]MBA9087168.1 glycolate oxidase iron-sulfur subunit [Fontibacillus solani]